MKKGCIRDSMLSLLPALLLLGVLGAGDLRADPVTPFSALNSRADDYAVAIRETRSGSEVWLTTSRDLAEPRSRRIWSARWNGTGADALEPLPEPVNRKGSAAEIMLDGCPTFSPCSDIGIIATNRPDAEGKDRDNDLYQIVPTAGGWSATRIDAISSPAWDDSPALSPDGRLLYFASDRRSPGSRRTDLFLSVRTAAGWSTPVALDGINTPKYSEQAPSVGADGYLYYTTDQSSGGDYDIWRVKLDPQSGMPVGAGEPVPFPGVNLPGSNEGHPVLSPGGGAFIFSSDRDPNAPGRTKDFDLYWTTLPTASPAAITLRVQLRTREFNGYVQDFQDVVRNLSADVRVHDLTMGHDGTLHSDTSGLCTIMAAPADASTLPIDPRNHVVTISARPPSSKYVSATDTLVFGATCTGQFQHTLYLWDTAVYYSPTCDQKFPITNVQFFITGYWCPTTDRYRAYTPCRSVFPEPECATLDIPKPEAPCKDNDLYRYEVRWVKPVVERKLQPGLCIDMREAEQRRGEFARLVDSAVGKFVDNMAVALRVPCVQNAIRMGKPVRVEIEGWTDPRTIRDGCEYTGETIDFNASFIKLEEIEKKHYIKGGILASGTPFQGSGAGGNQLLSDLRAYYTAILLDSIWRETVPEYRALRNNPGMLEVTAIGRAISQQNLPMEQQRSVNVRVTTPSLDQQAVAASIPKPGTELRLCGAACDPGKMR